MWVCEHEWYGIVKLARHGTGSMAVTACLNWWCDVTDVRAVAQLSLEMRPSVSHSAVQL